MKREIDLQITPKELAEMFLKYDPVEVAEFFNHVSDMTVPERIELLISAAMASEVFSDGAALIMLSIGKCAANKMLHGRLP